MGKALNYTAGVGEKAGWVIEEKIFDPSHLGKCEAIFCQGNGYLGQRAALEEAYVGEKRNLFVTGTFDKFDAEEVTELPNLPDLTNLELTIGGCRFGLDSGQLKSYSRQLDLEDGFLSRHVEWVSPAGDEISLDFERFVSLADEHVLGQRVKVSAGNRDVEIKIKSGINGRVTNTGTQHFHEGKMRLHKGFIMEMCSATVQSEVLCCEYAANLFYVDGQRLDLYQLPVIDRRFLAVSASLTLKAGQTLTVEKLACVHTSRDKVYEGEESAKEKVIADGRKHMEGILESGYDALAAASRKAWKEHWATADVLIESQDSYDQIAVRFALYHLNIMVKKDDDRVGIGAKALSGEGYKGHSFWDTEIFLLPYYILTDPNTAKTLLSYRGKSLPGAYRKAKENGFKGAMFPWESAWLDDGEVTPLWGGADVVTGKPMKILTGVLEQHISADVAFAVWQYFIATGDQEFLDRYGYEIVIGTALFWTDRVEWKDKGADGQKCYITDVIGPDEYKEHVDNNAYTNYLVHWNLVLADRMIEELQKEKGETWKKLEEKFQLEQLLTKIRETVDGLYLPLPNEDGIIPQFDRYFDLKKIDLTKYKECDVVGTIYNDYNIEQISSFQVLKQADTILLMLLMDDAFDTETKEKNYRFYEERTLHDSSLSKSTHCIMAAELGWTKEAYHFFRGCLDTDLGQVMTTSDMGIHSACMGGIWQSAVCGFGGVRILKDRLRMSPQLPQEWSKLAFHLVWQGCPLYVTVEKGGTEIKNLGEKDVSFYWGEEEISIPAGEKLMK
nr:glycosyl hydrolase family 65 protein [uncultured Acetatifactor sp.]